MISLFAREDRDAKRQRWHDPEHFKTILDRGNSRRTIRAESAYADRAREGEPMRQGCCADIQHKGHVKTLFKDVMSRLAGGMVMALLAVAVFGSPMVSAQGAGVALVDKHDLTPATGTGLYRLTTPAVPASEMCVFCHTPYGETASAAVPLWNGTLAPPAAYTTYNSLGTSGTDGATAAAGSMSIVCFSCHDGASSMNMVINTPESGSMARIDSWSGKAAPVTAGSLMTVWRNPGQDSRNDHPIGNPYGGGLRSGTVPTMVAGSNTYVNLSFRNTDFRSASGTLVNGKPVWWVDTGTGGSGTREKTDIQLHTRSHVVVMTGGETRTVMEPVIECASCHDPHTSNVIFQRIPNAGSVLCLTCHALGNF